MKRYKDSRKEATSVALDEKTIEELKLVAEKLGIPLSSIDSSAFDLGWPGRLKKAA